MRKTFIIIICCIAVLLAGYAGYRGYNVWKCSHLMSLAHQFLAKADGRNALLCVQQVLRADPHNLDATRVMAQLDGGGRVRPAPCCGGAGWLNSIRTRSTTGWPWRKPP